MERDKGLHLLSQLGIKEKADISAGLSSEAPPAEQFSNQLFEDLKKLYDLKPFVPVIPLQPKGRAIVPLAR